DEATSPSQSGTRGLVHYGKFFSAVRLKPSRFNIRDHSARRFRIRFRANKNLIYRPEKKDATVPLPSAESAAESQFTAVFAQTARNMQNPKLFMSDAETVVVSE
ncbi:MAG: hypothetical protein KDB01_25045, partial [Planctomycetaceae bacterium]|nr:hypothetical protein [Planctomycetaceae bacterium]